MLNGSLGTSRLVHNQCQQHGGGPHVGELMVGAWLRLWRRERGGPLACMAVA
jgi:hypothetical protein